MRRILFILFVSFFATKLGAQVNLVPNPSFELYDTCPSNEDQVQYATGWYKCSGNNVIFIGNTTPDYYNACSSAALMGVPQSGILYQQDVKSCGAYMGLITQNMPSFTNYREQIGIQLSSPLVMGQKYYLSFIAVMGGSTVGTDNYENPSNNIGMRLSTIAYNNPANPAPIDNFAHLRSTAIITDSVNWMRITGSIIADSAYNYVLLGNFYDDTNTDTIMYNCGTCYNYYSYYLVDDICVSTDSLLANGGIDTLPCMVSVPVVAERDEISIFPNPVSDVITLSLQNNNWDEVHITDLYGKLCVEEILTGMNFKSIDLTSLGQGVYFLDIIDWDNGHIINRKIIKL